MNHRKTAQEELQRWADESLAMKGSKESVGSVPDGAERLRSSAGGFSV
jgi:hypothetical protein